MDAVLSFESCAVHTGENGWDSGVVSDPVRVYVVDLAANEVQRQIELNGLKTAETLFDKATLSSRRYGEWESSTINYVDAPGHTLWIRGISFYFRQFGRKTVVFVFMHQVGDPSTHPVLDSFRYPAHTSR